MYNLKTTPILTDWQKQILVDFFASPVVKNFYLTGGTALSAFYFAHRESKDLDLFSSEPFEMKAIQEILKTIGSQLLATYSEKVSTQTYKEIYLEHADWTQRIDIVREQPIHFGDIVETDAIHVDTLENIGSNKITAIFGRLEPKDYIDLYMIIHHSPWTFDKLFSLAKQKDAGLEPFFFAYSASNIDKIETWPELRVSVNVDEIREWYRNLAKNILERIKPPDVP